jgi:hypothetical protein
VGATAICGAVTAAADTDPAADWFVEGVVLVAQRQRSRAAIKQNKGIAHRAAITTFAMVAQ